MWIGSELFQNGDLSTTLHHQLRGLRQRVEAQFRPGLGISDEQLASEIAAQARFQPLMVDFDSLKKDVASERLTIRDYGREIEVDGVRVLRRSSPLLSEAKSLLVDGALRRD
ncbi:hypothetical protein MESS4_520013 [Mesorhizobium sp. STM 4661]|nr:hypothetical protein MESS4_520013 [Mesorhizobium sp. STM 4661]